MKPAATIPRRRGPAHEAEFEPLRSEGLRWLQQASGERWTDFNLHDPGVTMLEQLCFALAGLAYRADFPVADLLCDPDGRIDFDALGLHSPQAVLPCGATTADDLCRVLLDRVQRASGVGLAPLCDAPLQGLHRLTVETAVQDDAEAACREAQAVFMAHRPLGEDLDAAVRPMQPWWCSLEAQLEIEGSRDPLDVAAEVLAVCARCLAAPVGFQRLDDLERQGVPLDRAFEGPSMLHGFIADAALRRQRQEFFFVCDLLELVRGIDGVSEVKWLALRPEGGEPATGMLRWRDGASGRVLRLRAPDDAQAEGEGLQLWRRGTRVDLPAGALRTKVDELRRAGRAHRRASAGGPAELAMPRGKYRGALRPAPVQELFPPHYGLNVHGVPDSAGVQRQAQALQLRAYLALCEQQLAHGSEQLARVRELFGTDASAPQSYWWHTLDDEAAPGVEALMLPGAPAARRDLDRAWPQFDPAIERKGRVLDHLLALHGQSWPQNTLRQFWTYLDDDEVDRALLQAKAAFVRDVVAVNRDRAAGADYTRAVWNEPANCSGLQRVVAHLLGLQSPATRALTAAVSGYKRVLAADAGGWWAENPGGTRLELDRAWRRPQAETLRDELSKLAPLRSRELAEPVLRAAVHGDRYWSVPRSGGGVELVLGPDEQGRYWPLASYPSAREALVGAQCLRSFLMAVGHASEGLHVVEHLLLRPIGRALEEAERDFLSGRVTVVLPAWTERFRQANFRAFAEETVALVCPVQLQVRCAWLEFEPMQRFEEALRQWYEALRAHALGGGDATRRDAASAALAAILRTTQESRDER